MCYGLYMEYNDICVLMVCVVCVLHSLFIIGGRKEEEGRKMLIIESNSGVLCLKLYMERVTLYLIKS